jgi:hypothetical protein
MKKTVEVEVSPEELAEVFCEFGDDEQAAFFAAIKPITDKWGSAGLCSQSNWICRKLNDDGRFVLETLASHLPAESLKRLAKNAE